MPGFARVRRAAAIAVLGLSGCSTPTQNVSVQAEIRSFLSEGKVRRYTMVATTAADTADRPLLLVLHGAGGNAFEMWTGTSLAEVGRANGLTVAFLESLAGYNGLWSVNPVDLETVDDLAYMKSVVNDIAAVRRIDRSRIFLVGYSRGGDLAYSVACRDPEFARGIVNVAATMRVSITDWCAASRTASKQPAMMMIVGATDPLMPWDRALDVRRSVLETATVWADRNGCTASPQSSPLPARAGYALTRFTYAPCAKAELQLLRIDGLQHNWPSAAFDAEQAMVAWLLSLPRN